MASIEDRIVQMQFDNTAFERKMSTTISSLEKLSATIAKTGSKNGLEEVSRSARNFNLTGMASSIEGVSKKFLALSTIGITVLANLTTRALSAGTQLVKSLALQPVIDGFREYELQIGSIQTILSNTAREGTTLTQVNDALDVLNEYSDKTIYNFGEMTRNIGTFTAAGVDLDTSVSAIKGIANLAAISGSSSQQASTAMYQLSQAIATGSVKLMDWNSVVNAGMGGEVFQRALFDTGVAMQTITDVPMGTTFEEWTDAGNSFRGSLQDGWLTSEVLTNTLQAFTGEMTEAQLTAIGFTKEQAQEMIKLGEIGVDAATKVRTFTQLISTTKEALGSGWSQSFRIIFGDFEEATRLWTNVSDAIGGAINKNAEARNEMLKTWDELGGRTKLIKGIQTAFKALGEILAPIKEAFRDIFPASTGESLFELTKRFNQFARSLRPSEEAVEKIRSIFRGFFAALEIGWTVIKEGVKFVADLAKELFNFGSGNFSKGLANIGDFVTGLHEMLVTEGGIKQFFDKLRDAAEAPIDFIKELVSSIRDFFSILGVGGIQEAADSAGDSLKKFGDRFSGLKDIVSRLGDIWEPFKNALSGITGVLDTIWEPIRDWFKELGQKLADVMEPGDYDKALDTFNTAFLGGIVVLLRKFLKGGFNINFKGGILDSITDTFGELTGVLKAMQMDIKANAILKIAAALGILALSLLLLATINSEDLTRALTAMAIGFGEIVATFALLNTIAMGPVGAAKMATLSAGLILLATAMLILSAAVKSLSELSWEELLRGLAGITGMLAALSLGTLALSLTSGGMIRSGIGLILIAAGMNILALAVRQFSGMAWEDIGKGMAGIAGGLVIIAGAMNLMPPTMPLIGAGLLLVAIALPILAGAVKILATMSWSEIGRGMASLAGGLLIIAAAMNLMPPTLPITASGLILVSVGLIGIAGALKLFSGLSWSEIGRGLAGMAGSLVVLAAASYAMSGTIGGAIAIGILSVALMALFEVVKEFASIDTGELVRGLLAMAGALVAIGLTALLLSPAIGAIAGLGAALILLGAGFALFGVGAQAIAKAFELLGKAGSAGISVLMDLIDALIDRLPEMAKAAAKALQGFVASFLEGMPAIVKALGVLLQHILETLRDLIPEAAKTIGVFISSILKLIRDKVPEFVKTGFKVLMSFLQGIRDNIGEIAKTVADIITNFLDALSEKIPQIIDSVYNFIVAVIEGVIAKLGNVSLLLLEKGVEFITGLLDGMKDKLPDVTGFFKSLPGKILRWIGNVIKTLFIKGKNFIQGLLDGLADKVVSVMSWFSKLPGRIVRWLGSVIKTLFQKGKDIVQGFLDGVIARAVAVTGWFSKLPGRVVTWVGGVLQTLRTKGLDIVQGFLNGVLARAVAVIGWFEDLPGKVVDAIGGVLGLLTQIGRDIMQGLWDGLTEKWDSIWNWIQDKINSIPGIFRSVLGIGSPSKLMMYYGEMIGLGLAKGLEANAELSDNASRNMVTTMKDTINESMARLIEDLNNTDEFQPVVTPVLDLTQVHRDAATIGSMIPEASLAPDVSYAQAQMIATTKRPFEDAITNVDKQPSAITFEQNIYAPKQLSTGDIYRQTRNQITSAKEELAIP